MTGEQSSKVTLSRPKDKSLETYKAWITEIVLRLNPDAKDTLTEEQWVDKWKRFWAKVEEEPSD